MNIVLVLRKSGRAPKLWTCARPRFAVLFAIALICVLASPVAAQSVPPDPIPSVILISIDGFRYDYPEKAPTPNLRSLIAGGVRAAGLIPQFPTLTFPNHYAIVTGLVPAHNGIVANTMYDPSRNAVFKMSDRAQVANGRWWGGEPIWITAEKQGRRTAPMFWPGSEAEIHGIRPAYWLPYDKKKSNADRVKQILDWLDLPAGQRPKLLTLYFDEVDTAGHDYGPESAEVKTAIQHVDFALGQLLAGLRQRGLEDEVNLVIVSDHGMLETSCKRIIDLRPLVDREHMMIAEHDAVLTLYPKDTTAEAVLALLRNIPHMTVYGSSETPLRWSYRGNLRIAPVIGVADPGWSIVTQDPSAAEQKRGCTGGKHGYDNDVPSMYGVFIAHGPAFQPGSQIPAFDNIDIYVLLAKLLNVRPAPSDGSLAPLQRVLRPSR